MRFFKGVLKLTMSAFIFVGMSALFLYAAPMPDIIHELQIDLYPQVDGSVEMFYTFDYEVTSPPTSDYSAIEINMPNGDFDIKSYQPSDRFSRFEAFKASSALLQFSKEQLPSANERLRFNFTLVQNKLFFEGESEDRIILDFTPGWFDDALIQKVVITVDRSLVTPLEIKHQPHDTTAEKYTWYFYNLKEGELTSSVNLTYMKKDFDLSEGALAEKESPVKLLKVIGFTALGLVIYIIFIRLTGNRHTGDKRYLWRMPGQRG